MRRSGASEKILLGKRGLREEEVESHPDTGVGYTEGTWKN